MVVMESRGMGMGQLVPHGRKMPHFSDFLESGAIEFVYGKPDTYYSTEKDEIHQLALPKNIFGSEERFKNYLESNYSSEFGYPSHECVVQETAQDFSSKQECRIPFLQQSQQLNSETMDKIINCRFDETNIETEETVQFVRT